MTRILFSRIFKNLIETNPKNTTLLLILFLVEISQVVLMTDIIFNKNANFVNFYFPIYFISPVFYLEILNSYYRSENQKCIPEILSKDQLTILKQKYFESPNNCEINNKVLLTLFMSFVILLLFLVLFLFNLDQLTSKRKSVLISTIKFLMFIPSLLFYICFKTLNLTFFVILSNKIIIQILLDRNSNLDFTFFLNFIILITYFITSSAFNIYFIKTYENSVISIDPSLLKETISIIYKLLIALLINLRLFDTRFNLFFKFLSLIFFFYINYVEQKIYIKNVNLKFSSKLKFFILCFTFCYVLVEFCSFFINLINFDKNYKDKTDANIIEQSIKIILTISSSTLIFSRLDNYNRELIDSIDLKFDSESILTTLIHVMSYNFNKEILNENVNFIELENKFFQLINKWLINHQFNCLIEHSILEDEPECPVCEFYQNKLSQDSNNNIKQIFPVLLLTLKIQKRKLFFEKDKLEFQKIKRQMIILKIIIYYNMDKQISRVNYYINKKIHKTSTDDYPLEFYIILFYLKEKVSQFTLSEEGLSKSFNKLKCIYIYDNFQESLNICEDILGNMPRGNDKPTKLKLLDRYNLQFGNLFRNLEKDLISLKIEQKEKEKFTYIKYLWIFYGLFNTELDFNQSLDTQEVIEIFNENYVNNHSFILKKEFSNSNFIIKKIPSYFIETLKFTKSELLGQSFEFIFPFCLQKYEKKRINKLFILTREKKLNLDTVICDREGYLKDSELSVNILPSITQNVHVICKLQLKSHENVGKIIVDQYGEIKNINTIFTNYFGITPLELNLLKSRLSLKSLFNFNFSKILETKNEIIEFEIKLNLLEYLQNYKMVLHLTSNDNNKHDDNFRFYKNLSNYSYLETHLSTKHKYVNLYFCLIRNVKISSNKYYLFEVKFQNKFFFPINITMTQEEKHLDSDEEGNTIINYYNAAKSDNASIASSNNSLRSVKYDLNETTQRIINNSKKQIEKLNVIGRIIKIFNILIILFGIFLISYLNSISTGIFDAFSFLSNFRQMHSNYFNHVGHLLNMIELGHNNKKDYYNNLNLEKYFNKSYQNNTLDFNENLRIIFKNSEIYNLIQIKLNQEVELYKENGETHRVQFVEM